MQILSDLWRGLSIAIIYWWVYLPPALIYIFFLVYRDYKIEESVKKIEWVLLEVKTPANLEKSPKVTEQFFAGLHGILFPLKWKERNIAGKITKWFSMEIVGIGGAIHFYIRTPIEFRNMVEAQIFAQYPDSEISEAHDYINDLPAELPDANYDLWGNEYRLARENVYPIRTYVEFEDAGGLDEAKRVDPLAAFSELLSNLKSGEQIWIQFVVQPTGAEIGDKWDEEGKTLIEKLTGREQKKEESKSIFAGLGDLIEKLVAGPPAKKEEKRNELVPPRTPLEEEQAKGITRKMSKVGFRCGARFIYIANREVYNFANIIGSAGAFKQFSSRNLNSFRSGFYTGSKGWFAWLFPSDKGFFHSIETLDKKKRLYQAARAREISLIQPPMVLNTEELATVYHLPGLAVRTPFLPRVESKKGQPPSTLPEK